VVAKVRERLSVSKRAAQKFDIERFNLKNINDVEAKEEYQVKPQIGSQHCKSWMITWTSTGLGKVLERM
jgi:hypothetical protein